jgi:hypothetical protein
VTGAPPVPQRYLAMMDQEVRRPACEVLAAAGFEPGT